MTLRLFAALVAAFGFATMAFAQTPKIPVIVDTDIGTDIDDAYALGLVLVSPELDLQAVTTVGGQAEDRAWIVCRFLAHSGRGPIPVAFGRDPQPDTQVNWQIQYRRHPSPIFNRTQKPAKESAIDLLAAKLKANPGKITVICLGPLTNIAKLLQEHPDAKQWIGRLVVMGGSIRIGYEGKKQPEPEWNFKLDIPAAKAVFASGIPITLVPLDATSTLQLKHEQRERIFSAYTVLTFQIQNLYELWDQETPILFDPAAVAGLIDPSFFTWEDLHITIDDQGMSKVGKGKANAHVAMNCKQDEFLKWFTERLRNSGKESLPQPPKNLSKLIPLGNFPSRVHVFEDYDTDIEKRWWMSGKAETKDLAPEGRRCNRAVLTQDFDDRQGEMKTSYRAVVFNPVPGPPMGANTRLSFRYKLTGTDRLRVQLYSLTNGYHRYLSLEKVEQGKWLHGTVDMTKMLRPDGSGGALSKDERIDDIQFYIDPRAELLIDDVILYDAAAEGEKRPFPKRVLFTGLFDTGKQGKEWPGDFEIVAHEKPRTWKAAKSVIEPSSNAPWIRVHLRGERRLSPITELTLQYQSTEAETISVELRNSKTKWTRTQEVKGVKTGNWSETTLRFEVPIAEGKPELSADEIIFRVTKGSLIVDNVLLYEPGK